MESAQRPANSTLFEDVVLCGDVRARFLMMTDSVHKSGARTAPLTRAFRQYSDVYLWRATAVIARNVQAIVASALPNL